MVIVKINNITFNVTNNNFWNNFHNGQIKWEPHTFTPLEI